MATDRTNADIVVAFYRTAFGGDPQQAVADCVAESFVDHNTAVSSGTDAFIGFVQDLCESHPRLELDIWHVVAEGDLVATHARLHLQPGDAGLALADFFRLDGGRIVEHWDVVQELRPA